MRIVSVVLPAFLLICWPSDRTAINLTVPPEELEPSPRRITWINLNMSGRLGGVNFSTMHVPWGNDHTI